MTEATLPVQILCPYCGNSIAYIPGENILDLWTCDSEENYGCGRVFAVSHEVEIHAKTHKIEGQEVTESKDPDDLPY